MAKARVIALYLPQFHPIPENDKWWGKGFTEWRNVAKAKPLFPGHHQPNVPTDLGFYDLRVPETRLAQAEMAGDCGIEGFCYWHYWFGNGKQLLEKPFNEVLSSGKPDFPFCLAWANESWRGIYHGIKSKETLIDQSYPGKDDYTAHFYNVLPAFRDKRYITVDGKPFFMIYRPMDNIKAIGEFIGCWRKLAEENGLEGIYFVGETYHIATERRILEEIGFDAINEVRLFQYEHLRHRLKRKSEILHNLFGYPYIVDYEKASRYFTCEEDREENIIPTIIPNWDHTPRSGKNGLVLKGSSPEKFDRHLKDIMEHIEDKPSEHRIAILKSWNEWAEGNYVEPDLQFGYGYMNILKKYLL